jgi:hypothetical protein
MSLLVRSFRWERKHFEECTGYFLAKTEKIGINEMRWRLESSTDARERK